MRSSRTSLEKKVHELTEKAESQKKSSLYLQQQIKELIDAHAKQSDLIADQRVLISKHILKIENLRKECKKLEEAIMKERARTGIITESHDMLIRDIEVGIKRSRAMTPPRQIMRDAPVDPPSIKEERARAIKKRRQHALSVEHY